MPTLLHPLPHSLLPLYPYSICPALILLPPPFQLSFHLLCLPLYYDYIPPYITPTLSHTLPPIYSCLSTNCLPPSIPSSLHPNFYHFNPFLPPIFLPPFPYAYLLPTSSLLHLWPPLLYHYYTVSTLHTTTILSHSPSPPHHPTVFLPLLLIPTLLHLASIPTFLSSTTPFLSPPYHHHYTLILLLFSFRTTRNTLSTSLLPTPILFILHFHIC